MPGPVNVSFVLLHTLSESVINGCLLVDVCIQILIVNCTHNSSMNISTPIYCTTHLYEAWVF